MKQRVCLVLACSLLLLFLPAISCLAVESPGSSAAIVEFDQGRQFYQSGDLQRSLAVLRTYVQRYPEHPQVPEAYTLIGQIFSRQERYNDVLLYLERIPTAFRSPEASLLTGYALVQTEQFSAAQQQLLPLLEQPLDQPERQRLLLALADAAVNLDQSLRALVFLHQVLPIVATQLQFWSVRTACCRAA